MTDRLVDRFPVGSLVEITLDKGLSWRPGEVIRHQFPAVWVQTANGQEWFVTNSGRIRAATWTVTGDEDLFTE